MKASRPSTPFIVIASLGLLGIAGVFGWQWYLKRQAAAEKAEIEKHFVETRAAFVRNQAEALKSATRKPEMGPARLVLSDAPEMDVPRALDPEELARQWPAFKHEPFETSGFHVFVCPLEFRTTTAATARPPATAPAAGPSSAPAAEPAICFAFAQLLWEDLCWSGRIYIRTKLDPGNRDAKSLTRAQQLERMQSIDGASHMVGGVLVQGPDGYSGTLEIRDRAGRVLHEKKFEQPRSVFELLGDFSAEAFTYFGEKPSEAFAKHLRRVRCKPESLGRWGKAEAEATRSSAVTNAYAAILRDDPDFAELRNRYALRLKNVNDNGKAYVSEIMRSMESGLTARALEEFDPSDVYRGPNPLQEKEVYAGPVKQAEALVGPDSYLVLTMKLRRRYEEVKQDPTLFARAVRVAGTMPNRTTLLREVATACMVWGWRNDPPPVPADADLEASLGVALMLNRDERHETKWAGIAHFATATRAAGRHDLALAARHAMDRMDSSQSGNDRRLLAEKMLEVGQYQGALNQYAPGLENPRVFDPARPSAYAGAITAAGIARSGTVLQQLLKAENMRVYGLIPLAQAYLNVLDGKPVDDQAVVETNLRFPELERYRVVLLGQLDVGRKRTDHYQRVLEYVRSHPNDRLAMIVYEQYLQDPPGLHEWLEWEHAHDPWAVQAVAAWRKRRGQPVEIDLARLKESLSRGNTPAGQTPPSLPNPWAVAAAVRQQLTAGNPAAAREVATAYRDAVAPTPELDLQSLANHLLHRTEQSSKPLSEDWKQVEQQSAPTQVRTQVRTQAQSKPG